MPKKDRRKKKKKMKRRWYYDACALGYERKTIDEIRSFGIGSDNREAVISYLALGEAYGKCCKKSEETAKAFVELIQYLLKFNIKIVGNDVGNSLFKCVKDKAPALKIADAIHLATAIQNKCENLRTTDRDLYGLDKKTLQELRTQYGILNFTISKMR